MGECFVLRSVGWRMDMLTMKKPLTAEQSSDYELIPQKFPQYVKTYDGYIGVLIGLEYGEFPIYRFPGGERVADRYEIETGSNSRSNLE